MINKKLLGRGGVFFISNILNALVPFLLLPVLTRLLTPEDYGVLAMFTIFLSLTGSFVGLSVHGAINVQYYKLKSHEFSEYVTSCLMLLVVSTVVVFIIVYLLGGGISVLIGLPLKWMLLAVLVSFFQFFIQICLTIWVVTGKALNYGSFQISQTLLNALLSLFFVIYQGLMWEGRALGQTLSIVFFGLLALIIIYKSGYIKSPKSSAKYINDSIKFGVPLIPHTIGAFVIYSTDRVMISALLGVSVVGVYMVALQLGQVMKLVSDSFNKVYAPWIMSNLSKGDINKERIVFFSYLSMFIILFIGIIWGVGAVLILPVLVGERFQQASEIIIIMSLGFSFTGLYYLVVNYIFYTKKTTYLVFITLCSGIINIPLTYFLTDEFGLLGAAIAFLLVQVLFFIFTWLLAAKLYPMPWFYFLKRKKNA